SFKELGGWRLNGLAAFLQTMRPQIPLERFAIVPEFDGGVVVQLPQLFEMRIKLFGGGCGLRLRQSKPWIGGRKRQHLNIERRRYGTSMRRGPDYIQHPEVPHPTCGSSPPRLPGY